MTAFPRLVLLGAGGHGRVVADIALSVGYSNLAFLDERWHEIADVLGFQVIAAIKDADGVIEPDDHVFIAIGSNRKRIDLLRAFQVKGVTIPVLVDPSAIVSRFAAIGEGTAVMANVVVNAGADIGQGVILNTACSVDHDCRIEDGVHISPGAHLAGSVRVGEQSWIGIGSAVCENILIGRGCIVGAGSAVVATLSNGARVGGVPARPI